MGTPGGGGVYLGRFGRGKEREKQNLESPQLLLPSSPPLPARPPRGGPGGKKNSPIELRKKYPSKILNSTLCFGFPSTSWGKNEVSGGVFWDSEKEGSGGGGE